MALHEQAPLPFYERPELPQLDRFQRIEVLGMPLEGFLPVTKPEQVEVLGLIDVIEKPWGTSKHLAEVRIRQGHTRASDPESASRKIVRNYVDWALDSQQTMRDLDTLESEIKDINPELPLSEPDLTHDIGRVGLLKFMRFFDLAYLREKGRIKDVGYDPQKVNYSFDNPGIRFYLDLAQQSWRVGQLKRKIPLAQQDAVNRYVFWTPRLVEITKHSPKSLKAIANDGLDKIYDRNKV